MNDANHTQSSLPESLTEVLKTRLLPAVSAAFASTYLFTIGVFDALGIDYTPSLKDAALFVFRITFLNFFKGVLQAWDILVLLPMSIYFLSICIQSFKLNGRNKNILALAFAIFSIVTLAVRICFTFNERLFLVFGTVIAIAAPFLGIAIVELANSKLSNANKSACVIVSIMTMAGSYLVGIKALEKNIRFPMIQMELKSRDKLLKVWQSEDDLYLIRCAIQKSIQVWRWTDEGFRLYQILVSDGSNNLDDICTRSTK